LTVAWAFYRRKGFLRELVYTLAVLAWIIPEAVAAFAWSAYLNVDRGTLNSILNVVGLGKPDWLFDHPLLTIIIFNTWRGSAFSILLFSSALETIPPSYLETADVVGASAWRKFRDILFPMLRGHILTDLILITLWTFNVFTPFLLTGGGPTFKSELVSIYTYRTAFKFFEFGRGGAIAVVMMVINFVLALGYLFMLRRQRATS
jgi:multiple sugar transport system permease protein